MNRDGAIKNFSLSDSKKFENRPERVAPRDQLLLVKELTTGRESASTKFALGVETIYY